MCTTWELLGRYGTYLNRFDLIHSGYEMALRCTTPGSNEQRLLERYKEILIGWREPLLLAEVETELARYKRGESHEPWHVDRDDIERYGFKEGKHDVIHFVDEGQWAAWHRLAGIEGDEEIDDYMRSLAPAEMIYIPTGNFLMGSRDDDPEAKKREKPQHWVYLPGYYIDRYPVTNRQYASFIKAGGYDRQELWSETGWKEKVSHSWQKPSIWEESDRNREQQPVVGISWYEGLACARWLGKMLPSEAQWEKAAGWDPVKREKRIYPWGNELIRVKREGKDAPEIGLNSPERDSPYGVANMAGVVYNWCTTVWYENAYQKPMEERKKLEELKGTGARINKGGGYSGQTKFLRCGVRSSDSPTKRHHAMGIRCIIPHAFPADPSS